jgi:CHAD domain-containing protein
MAIIGVKDVSSSAPAVQPKAPQVREKFGLAHWMSQVLEECDRAEAEFAKDPVHDLRVALRRCRSMADGLMAIDPSPEWRRMKKAGKQLFSALGNLRDAQVMTDWIEELSSPEDPVAKVLATYAAAHEHGSKQSAQAALHHFDRKRWARWMDELPQRAIRIPLGGPVFLHIALERWDEAHELHRRVLRSPSNAAWHRLRIAIKKFRYIVENFLPALHDTWIDDLKKLQDYLGEVHDLDVLWTTAVNVSAFPDAEARQRWRTRILEERQHRIEKYREKMVGPTSLWQVWRKALPQDDEIEAAAFARFRLWAGFLDPDPRHSQRVCRLALQLYDRLLKASMIPRDREYDLRSVLRVAATLHEVGRSKGEPKHHKRGSRMIRRMATPLGYEPKDLQLAAMVARYHRGALPATSQKGFARLTPAQQRRTLLLAGILRLADSLDANRDGKLTKLTVAKHDFSLVITADGYDPLGPSAARVAVARHPLEALYNLPVIVHSDLSDKVEKISRTRSFPSNSKTQSKISGSRSAKKAV